jgi:hypothetical protein
MKLSQIGNSPFGAHKKNLQQESEDIIVGIGDDASLVNPSGKHSSYNGYDGRRCAFRPAFCHGISTQLQADLRQCKRHLYDNMKSYVLILSLSAATQARNSQMISFKRWAALKLYKIVLVRAMFPLP